MEDRMQTIWRKEVGSRYYDPIERKFGQFHKDNPEVYEQLKRLALQMRCTGRAHYGIKGLFKVLRWHHSLKTTDDDYKLNNNYHALYARLLMKQEPSLKGFFQSRERRA